EYPKDLTSYSDWYNTEFFPNRNLMLLTLATSYAYKINASNIAIGAVGVSYRDTSLSFLSSFMKCIEISLMPVNIIAPFADRQRDEVIQQAVRLNVPIEKTFSCNALSDRHCQLCSSCHEREVAFNLMRVMMCDKKQFGG
ncbi:MAG: 7-cyano-7-deazaguanine synthase, partial [Bacteroidales bacterium]|nr:7-cyano-7-deazaguanine synthase [Bacteroidales bacterium]